MTNRYTAYMTLMAQRDANLVTLALLSAGFAIAWISVDWLPIKERWRCWIKTVYEIGGLGIYILLLVLCINGFGG